MKSKQSEYIQWVQTKQDYQDLTLLQNCFHNGNLWKVSLQGYSVIQSHTFITVTKNPQESVIPFMDQSVWWIWYTEQKLTQYTEKSVRFSSKMSSPKLIVLQAMIMKTCHFFF